MARSYVPERGDLVWLQFNPQAGHEQSGLRPALVVSSTTYNEKTGLAIFCPITNQVKGYPFEVKLPAGPEGDRRPSSPTMSRTWTGRLEG